MRCPVPRCFSFGESLGWVCRLALCPVVGREPRGPINPSQTPFKRPMENGLTLRPSVQGVCLSVPVRAVGVQRGPHAHQAGFGGCLAGAYRHAGAPAVASCGDTERRRLSSQSGPSRVEPSTNRVIGRSGDGNRAGTVCNCEINSCQRMPGGRLRPIWLDEWPVSENSLQSRKPLHRPP